MYFLLFSDGKLILSLLQVWSLAQCTS